MKLPPRYRSILTLCALALFIIESHAQSADTNDARTKPVLSFSQVNTLDLAPQTVAQLKHALEAHQYIAAERILIPAIERNPHSLKSDRLLEFLGGVYFLDHDAWNAAIAWNKAKAIAPLPPVLEFSLAMAYIRVGHPDWARQVLETLAAQNPPDALYPYWLGRLDYDTDHYDEAEQHFQKAIRLDPKMAQAYDNLGLCYYQQNRNPLAIASYQKAIDLSQQLKHPTAWPYLNLAIAENAINEPHKAEAHLREAIRIQPGLAPAHFQMGNVLDGSGQTEAAIKEYQTAARLDPSYAEPHYALARIYRRIGKMAASKQEVETYLRLRARANASKHPHLKAASPHSK